VKRFFAFPLVRALVILVLFVGIATLLSPVLRLRASATVTTWTLVVVLAAVICAVEWFAVRRPPAAIGFDPRRVVRDSLLGVALGVALFSAVIAELAALGAYRIVAIHVTPELLRAGLLLVGGAALEELLFRATIFRLVAEWTGTWIGLAVSAIVFGLLHAFNPGASWVSTLAIALEAGVLLAAAFVVTQNLWFPIGVHFAWNFCEGPLYGTQISGRSFGLDAVSAHVAGPALITGGQFGPEAGIPAIVTCLAVAIALLAYARQRGLIVAPQWRRAATG